MNTRKRIEQLEAAAIRQGWDVLSRRMDARLKHLSDAQVTALRAALETYLRTGEETPGLIETLKELTQ
jgi:hypothetical protein